MNYSKNESRQRRRCPHSQKISGTSERPRLVIYRSNLHVYAQIVVDDLDGATLVAAPPRFRLPKAKLVCTATKAAQKRWAWDCLWPRKNISKVVFDRNGYLYHGRVKAVADGAREGGLEF